MVIEEKIIEKLGDEVVKKANPLKRIWLVVKNVIFSLMVFKWVIVFIVAWFDMVRQSILLSLTDRYQEGKIWKAILWIKTWRLIYGIIIGLLLAYYYEFDETFMKAIDAVVNWF